MGDRSNLTQIEQDAYLASMLAPVRAKWRQLLLAFVMAGGLGAAGSFLVAPTFTSTTSFLPPQQQQSSAAAALASLGSLTGLAAGSAIKSPAEQFVALMQSVTVSDRIIDKFSLMKVYDEEYRQDARKELGKNTAFAVGKKDGLITVSVEDTDPNRAAEMANQFVEELRRMTATLAVSEAQQRRAFFERQMLDAKTRLTAAQTALQASGFSAGALKAEPKAAAEAYAKLRAELAATEIRIQTLRSSYADDAPQVRQALATAQALRQQLGSQESDRGTAPSSLDADYVSKYREFKYQETLFDMMARQYELARVDEAREGALIQTVDKGVPAEKKTRPKRAIFAVVAAFGGALLYALWLVVSRQRAARRFVNPQ